MHTLQAHVVTCTVVYKVYIPEVSSEALGVGVTRSDNNSVMNKMDVKGRSGVGGGGEEGMRYCIGFYKIQELSSCLLEYLYIMRYL